MSDSRYFIRPLMLALVAALLLALLSLPHVAYAQAGATATVTTPKLNVRSGPGAGYSVVTTLVQGQSVTLTGRNANSSWAMVRLADGTEGWASTFYLSTEVAWSSLPVVGSAAAVEPTAIANTGSLNVRSGPSPAYDIMMVVGQGHVMSMIGRNGDGSWVQVRISGNVGWVYGPYIAPGAPIMSLPVTSGSVPPPAVPTAQPPASGTPAAPAPTGPGTAVVTTGRLNVRSGPGAGYSVAGTVDGGTLVTLLGRDSAGWWIKVRLPGGLEGWVSSLYLDIVEPAGDIPVLAPAEPSAVVSTGSLNVRSGPGTQYGVLVVLPEGAIVNLLARSADGAWVKVRTNGMEGWASAFFLKTTYNLAALPVANQ